MRNELSAGRPSGATGEGGWADRTADFPFVDGEALAAARIDAVADSQGMDLDQPRQVLRSGGNVLSVFLFDEDDDGLKDLWLWRVETISVGDVFLWLG